MFVQVTGLQQAGVPVPDYLTSPRNNTCNSHMVTLALVRWLSPHNNAVARDEQQRPLCPAPFDIIGLVHGLLVVHFFIISVLF